MAAVGGPPWQLPAILLLAAATSQVVAAIVLVSAAPELASGLFLGSRELALVHLYGLGTLSVAIFAVLLQLIPVMLRQRVPLERLAGVATLGVLVGAWIMALALWRDATGLAGVGGTLVGVGGLVLIALVGTALMRAARARTLGTTGTGLVVALAWFAITMGLGGSLLDNLRTPLLGTLTLRILAAHGVIAGLGWIGGVIVATALRLGPMLALAHGHPQRPGVIALIAWHAGVLGIAAGLIVDAQLLILGGAAVLAVGVLALGMYLAGVVRHRSRRLEAPIVHLVIGAVAMGCATGAIAGAAVGVFPVFEIVIPAALCVLIGLGAGVASGHLFKILPMIVWTGRFAPLAGTEHAPLLADMYPVRIALVEQWAFAAGVVALLSGCVSGVAIMATLGADLVALAAAVTLVAATLIVAHPPSAARAKTPGARGGRRRRLATSGGP